MKAFISYSHKDEHYLERLRVHLATLKKQNILQDWHDRDISIGSPLERAIEEALESSQIFFALVSPDYLASTYCTDIEMKRAFELLQLGKIAIVPIIVEPCDWRHTILGQLLALPKDGKSVSEWTNSNLAYLEIANGMRNLISELNHNIVVPKQIEPSPSSGASISKTKYKAKRDFSAVDRAKYLAETYDHLETHFKNSAQELNSVGFPFAAHFEKIERNGFTCIASNHGRKQGDAYITVRRGDEGRGSDAITVSHSKSSRPNQYNESYAIENDDYELFIGSGNWHGNHDGPDRQSSKILATRLWEGLLERAGISIVS